MRPEFQATSVRFVGAGSDAADFRFYSHRAWLPRYTTWNIGLLWLLMTLGSGTYRALGITRPGQKRVSDLARMQKACVVLRDRQLEEVDVSEIVLGDIVQVQGGADAELPCDGVVISGSLIVPRILPNRLMSFCCPL